MFDMFEYLRNEILRMIQSSYFDAKAAHDLIFAESDPYNRNLTSALAYMNNAVSKCSAAKAIYVSNIDLLDNDDVETFFQLLSVYADEFFTDYSTNHSFQWVSIEFEKLTEHFEHSNCSLKVTS
jgi:hypothetical protein